MRLASSAGNWEISRNESTCLSGMTRRWVSALGLMSRTATKPGAVCTCSPSRTSSQNKQSSGSEDPVLGHGSRAHGYELSHLGPHDPGRIVVALAPARPVHQAHNI